MDETLLITFLGGSVGKRAYEKTTYRFPDGKDRKNFLFGLSLLEYLQENDKVDLLLVGTTGSGWTELLNLVEDVPDQELFEKLSELERRNQVDEETLNRWRELVAKLSKVDIYCILLENPPEPESISKKVIHTLLELKAYRRIVLDITHAYRFMPYIVLLDLMLLRKLRNFELEIYYGFSEYSLEQNSKPVMHLTHLEDLVKANEALSVFDATGNFREYFSLVGVNTEAVNRAYFEVEINRPATRAIRNLVAQKVQKDYLSPVHKILIEEYLSGLLSEYIEDRMRNRAQFFYERGQYLKAITLLYEAILVKGVRVLHLGDIQDYRNRERVKEGLDRRKIAEWVNFKALRNACAHGTEPREFPEIMEALKSEERFKETVNLGFSIFDNLENILREDKP